MSKLYLMEESAPCRLVWWVSKLINKELELVDIDLLNKKEHLTDKFVKMNPRHCVPTYVEERKDDNNFVMTESRAISNRFLHNANMYQPSSDDLDEQSKVDEMVQYDLGTFYKRIGDYVYPQIFKGEKGDEKKKEMVEKSLEYLNNILEDTGRIAGGKGFTLADFTIRMSLTMLDFTDIDTSTYDNLGVWMIDLENLNLDKWCIVNKKFEEWVMNVKGEK